jgi:acetyl-CoA acetyltransferase
VILGAGMTKFGKFLDRSLASLAEEAAGAALADAGITAGELDMVFFANASAGIVTGQEMIRGQVSLQGTGLLGKPIVNVENACASASSAVHLARLAVLSGEVDVALVVGAEKLTHPDKSRSFAALASGADVGRAEEFERELTPPEGGSGSFFMDVYADLARRYMGEAGATERDFAAVAVKAHRHGALNPRAQYRELVTEDEVLESRMISPPLTLLMCSPIGDGAAALVVARDRHHGDGAPVRIRASVLTSGAVDMLSEPSPVARAAATAYEKAGLGPTDLDVVELHDASAPAELIAYEELGLCAAGDGPALLASGATALGGTLPVNTSGGLLSKGHPVGATGCAQLVELVDQLRGRAGTRQVEGARIGLAENAGGFLNPDPAAAAVTILSRG